MKDIGLNYKIKHSVLMLLFISIASVASCQGVNKVNMLKKLNEPKEKQNYSKYLKQSTNELEATASLIFLGYKNFFSSQDMASCVFHPSCSVYAMQSFQNDNPLLAYVKVFDRLTRCHPFTKRNEYPYYKKTTLLYDPVH